MSSVFGEQNKKIYELLSAITDEFVKRYSFASAGEFKNEFTEEDIFAVIKSKTSSNVAKEFLTYYNGLEQQWQAMRFDLSNQTGIYNERFTGHMSGSYLDLGGGDITLEVFAFVQRKNLLGVDIRAFTKLRNVDESFNRGANLDKSAKRSNPGDGAFDFGTLFKVLNFGEPWVFN